MKMLPTLLRGWTKNAKIINIKIFCEFLFMIVPFRVESLKNKLSDMNTVESRFLESSVSRTPPPPISRTKLFLRLNQAASLVHGFSHDKSVPQLFSTPQARSQQQTEILIHLLKKLTPVNDISGVLYLADTILVFSLRIW